MSNRNAEQSMSNLFKDYLTYNDNFNYYYELMSSMYYNLLVTCYQFK